MSNSADENNNKYTVSTKVEAVGGVARPACNPPEPPGTPNPSESEDEEDGLDLIGEGGFSTVYLDGGDKRGKQYALKIIPFGQSGDREDAVLEEARILRRLRHEHIVAYDTHWISGDGPMRTLFIRMEYCSGGSLSDAIEAGLDLERACRIVCGVLQALNYIHQSGFVHCDLRSQNVCLDGRGNGIIIDFGLAEKLDVTSQTEEVRYKGRDAEKVKYDIQDVGELMYDLFYGPFKTERDRAESVRQFKKETAPPFDYSGHRVPPLDPLLWTLLKGDLAQLPKPLTTEDSLEEESYSSEEDVAEEEDEDVEDLAEAVTQLKIETSPPFDYNGHCVPPLRDQLQTLPNPEPPMTEVSSEEESYSSEEDEEEDLSSNEPSAGVEREDTGFSIWERVFSSLGIGLPQLVFFIVLFFLVAIICAQCLLYTVACTLATIHKTFVYRMVYGEIVKLASRVS